MTAPPLPPFGISEFTTWPWSFEEDVLHYRELGIEAIEVCESKLDPLRALRQLELVRESGLQITSVQPRLHSLFPDQPRPWPEEPAARIAQLKESIILFGEAAPGTTLVTIPGAAPQGNFSLAFDTAVREYAALAHFAAEHGVRLALEPLSPILMNVDTFLCSLPEALEVVQQVDHPAFGVFVDVWHLWQDPALESHLRACGPRIFGVHINDWHRPRHFGDRLSLGDGYIPLSRFVRACHASGYRGAYTLEIFSSEHLPDSLWRQDLHTLVRHNKERFGEIWSSAFHEADEVHGEAADMERSW